MNRYEYYSKAKIEEREGQTGQQADRGIVEHQVAGDRFGQDIDDLPVEEIEDIDDQQDPQHRPRLCGNAGGR